MLSLAMNQDMYDAPQENKSSAVEPLTKLARKNKAKQWHPTETESYFLLLKFRDNALIKGGPSIMKIDI